MGGEGGGREGVKERPTRKRWREEGEVEILEETEVWAGGCERNEFSEKIVMTVEFLGERREEEEEEDCERGNLATGEEGGNLGEGQQVGSGVEWRDPPGDWAQRCSSSYP